MKSKTTAAILALFFGGFGAHRFYLGQWIQGLLYFLFIWTFITPIIAVIECIVFLTMSEMKFNMKYNPHYVMAMNAGGQQQTQTTVVINNTNTQGDNANVGAAAPTEASQPDNTQQTPRLSMNQDKKNPFKISGDKKYTNYDFDGAIIDYKKALNVNSKDFDAHFKLSCLYSIMENPDSAYLHLSKSVEHGFVNLDEIKTNDHLSFLRSQPTFDNFVANGYKLSNTPQLEAAGAKTLNLSDEVISRIEKLAEMKDKGLITEEEFAGQKSKLLV